MSAKFQICSFSYTPCICTALLRKRLTLMTILHVFVHMHQTKLDKCMHIFLILFQCESCVTCAWNHCFSKDFYTSLEWKSSGNTIEIKLLLYGFGLCMIVIAMRTMTEIRTLSSKYNFLYHAQKLFLKCRAVIRYKDIFSKCVCALHGMMQCSIIDIGQWLTRYDASCSYMVKMFRPYQYLKLILDNS